MLGRRIPLVHQFSLSVEWKCEANHLFVAGKDFSHVVRAGGMRYGCALLLLFSPVLKAGSEKTLTA